MTTLNSSKNLLNNAWNNIKKNNIPEAVKLCRQINQLHPQNADGWYLKSYLAFRFGDTNQSLESIEIALKLVPDNVFWLLHKAHTLLMMGNKIECAALVSILTEKKYNDVKINAELALILNKLHNYQAASDYYHQAISLSPSDSQLYFNLASIQRYLGDIQLAESNLDKAISLNPIDCEAYLLRSSLRKQTTESNHIEEMASQLAKGINNPIAQAQLCYAIAKEEEDLQQYQQSFKHLKQGADFRRSNMRYELKNDLDIIQKIKHVFNAKIFEKQISGFENNESIFILGLPRTGSTLVERIIGNHEEVNSAGELNNFALEMMKQCKQLTTDMPQSRTELVQLTSKINFQDLGKAYIQSTRPETHNNKYFIDKLPLNSLYVGLIHLALPNAKIIHVQRHPLDTCYSIYKQLFTNGYPFSYNLVELAEYYIEHHRLMMHWKKVLPNRIYSVAYEDIVSNLELESKNLIAHCNLDWQEACSQFHLNQSAAVTASATQVRQSVYKSSIDKWRCYEKQLRPVKQLLQQAGIVCD